MRLALRLLTPAAAAPRLHFPRAFATHCLVSAPRFQPPTQRLFTSAAYAGAAFDSVVNDLPYADFLRVPESDVLLDARHTKRQVRFTLLR